ncbi:tudor and KH domain-containing protein homolog isoform X2 [Hyposmocoma kahamanoa]|uniref:tudor and KH domain-containing protein homolog isoform X2 n=1 Tax=Hyposmocoma kahamanoa TaxID=1477025 RepID=UPI000E6D773F|nr:tudor and KH domain-containing protein homolog isoform X2 [Hyposmocoma kahamanoa]
MSSKLLVPVALGLSLVSVTAFVVYYVFKKDEEDDTSSKKKSVKTSRINVIEINVPKSIVPALIGRSGSNVKDIEKKTNVMIHFKKFSDKDYDVCIIRGRSHATQLAETMIHDFIKLQPVIVEDSLVVPNWSCGRIIGTGGENINDISHRSGARVRIEGNAANDNSTQRLVTFKGTQEQIAQAKKLIETCVAQEKCRREIEQSKRSPRHAQPIPAVASASASAVADHPDEATEGAGASIEVYVSAVSSPARFWVQLVGPQVAQLDDLVEHMTEYYNNKDNRANHALKEVSIGQVVAAVFRHDGRWYRARVHDIRPNEFDATQQVADVFYMDYGDSEYVATHELCELRADLLRLRFQAMECFLAGVKPAGKEEDVVGLTASGQRWDKWHPQAVERFEQLTQVARWKPLVSRTCTYKKTAAVEGDKEKEIPGIKLFDVTEEGELDVGATLIAEGWAVAAPSSPRSSPPRPPAPQTPFGDLGNSRILNMAGGARATSMPKDHKDDGSDILRPAPSTNKENDKIASSKSLGSGLESSDKPKSISNFDLTYSNSRAQKTDVNGSHDFLNKERSKLDIEGSNDTLIPNLSGSDVLKAKMNRIDSHHGNLEHLTHSQTDLHN